MNVLGYTESGMIRVLFEGDEHETFIPDNMDNRHRQLIAEWEAMGNAIPPYVQPPPTLPSLSRRQLRLGLLAIAVTADMVEAELAAIADPTERAAAMIEWLDASSYSRTHPLVDEVASAFALPPEQVDALWLWAAAL